MIKKSSFVIRKIKHPEKIQAGVQFEKKLLSEELLPSEKSELNLDGISELLIQFLNDHPEKRI